MNEEPKSQRRTPTYQSPSALSLFYKDRPEFYMKYIAPISPPRFKQTEPMSVGSAFDAFVKARLMVDLKIPGATAEELLIDQVDPELVDFARVAGARCLDAYIRSGAYAHLIGELALSSDAQFEATVNETITHGDKSVCFLGKPDLHFATPHGKAIYDWKVNGYCSKSGVSPAKGYVRASKDAAVKVAVHKDADLDVCWGGILYDKNATMLTSNTSWSDQTCIYGWTLGYEVGVPFLVGIDQLAIRPSKKDSGINCAAHRCFVSSAYQLDLWKRSSDAWNACQSGHIFMEMTRAESDAECDRLDGLCLKLQDPESYFTQFMRNSGPSW